MERQGRITKLRFLLDASYDTCNMQTCFNPYSQPSVSAAVASRVYESTIDGELQRP